jgi:hypothetical protein
MSFSFRFENALTRFDDSSRVTLSLLGRSTFASFLKGFIGTSEPIMFELSFASKRFSRTEQRMALGTEIDSLPGGK